MNLTTREFTLRRYLEALLNVKSLRERDGFTCSCFGSYSNHYETCNYRSHSPEFTICQVCRAQVERPSADWIKVFLRALEQH